MFINKIIDAGDDTKNGSSGTNDRMTITWGVGWLSGMGFFGCKRVVHIL